MSVGKKKTFKNNSVFVISARYIALSFIALCFATTAIMVVWMPNIDAHWYVNQTINDGSVDPYLYAINIGLHDNLFFAWSRPHVMVGLMNEGTVFDFFTDPWKFMASIDSVTKTQDGTYLHTSAIIITIFDVIAIVFATTMLFLNSKKQKINKSYLISSSMLIGGTTLVLMMAMLMKEGQIFGSLFTIEINANLGKDLAAVTATNPGTHPVEVTGVSVTCLDTDYTQLGMAAISILCIYSGVVLIVLAQEIKQIISNRK